MIKLFNILYGLYKVVYFNEDNRAVYKKKQFIWVKEDLKPLGLTVYPFIIVRSLEDKETINHEMIHIQQMKELLVIPFLILYGLNYIFNLGRYNGNTDKAYRNVIFEKEAYDNEKDLLYLTKRPKYNYIRK